MLGVFWWNYPFKGRSTIKIGRSGTLGWAWHVDFAKFNIIWPSHVLCRWSGVVLSTSPQAVKLCPSLAHGESQAQSGMAQLSQSGPCNASRCVFVYEVTVLHIFHFISSEELKYARRIMLKSSYSNTFGYSIFSRKKCLLLMSNQKVATPFIYLLCFTFFILSSSDYFGLSILFLFCVWTSILSNCSESFWYVLGYTKI